MSVIKSRLIAYLNQNRRKTGNVLVTKQCRKGVFPCCLLSFSSCFLFVDSGISQLIRHFCLEVVGESIFVARTTTGNDGQYEFQELVVGNYRLNVVAEGYQNTTFYVKVSEGRVSRMDMQLSREVPHTTLVRFHKVVPDARFTAMALWTRHTMFGGPDRVLVSHQFGGGSGISDYYEIFLGFHYARFLNVNSNSWYTMHSSFHFRAGRKYTFVLDVVEGVEMANIVDDGEFWLTGN